MADLVVKISGDMQDFSDMLKTAEEETGALNEKFKTLGEASGVALAVMTAAAYEAVKAFSHQEQAVNLLTQSLQTQGIYSKELIESYREQAEALAHKTGIDAEATMKGQALLQGMIGQVKITPELTKAAGDLSVKTGDVGSAFELIAKAADGHTAMLKRYGIEMVDQGSRAKNLEEITKKLNETMGGFAEAGTKGTGGVKLLKIAYDDMQKAIGERLAPAVEWLVSGMTKFFHTIAENGPLLDLIVSVGTAVAVVGAVGVAVGVAGMAFLKLKAAMLAAQIATEATSIAMKGLIGATGIGLLVIIVSEVYLHWGSIWPRMQAAFKAFAESIGAIAGSIGKILLGAFTMDASMIRKGWDDLKEALKTTMSTYNTVLEQKLNERKEIAAKADAQLDDQNNKAAKESEALKVRTETLKAQIIANKHKTILDQLQGFNAEYIKMEQQETAVLEALKDEANKKIWGKLREQLTMVRAMKFNAEQEALQQQVEFDSKILESNAEFAQLSAGQQAIFLRNNQQQLRDSLQTEQMARDQAAKDSLKKQIDTNNEFLKNQQKFGTAYALVNKLMHSEIFQGTSSAMGDLANLVNSKNQTLKEIGKAAALVNIGIKTTESAMNVFAGFSTIPIVGYGLGMAAAAAVIAYGAEQAAGVMGMAEGGLVTGGVPGRDSVPIMGMPGELMVPTRNFDEVVNAVAASRLQSSGEGGSSGAGGGHVVLELRLKDQLMDFLEAKTIQRSHLHISMQGS